MLNGLFPDHLTKSEDIIGGKRHTCVTCGLYKKCQTQKITMAGEGKKKMLIIGTAPNKDEDQCGRYGTGNEYMKLKKMLRNVGIKIEKDCWYMPAIACTPYDDNQHARNPKSPEILACRKTVVGAIRNLKPKVTVMLGWSAITSVIGFTTGSGISPEEVDKWRGLCIPDQRLNTFLIPTYHTQDLELTKMLAASVHMQQDLSLAVSKLESPFPQNLKTAAQITILDKDSAICKYLKNLLTKGTSVFAWDLETTGLKPHNTKIHEIGCMAICSSFGKAVSFDTRTLSSKALKLLKELMESKRIKKIAQNMKFEHTWAKLIWKIDVKGWEWDTMLATHCLNNASGVTGLKFQTYIQFGIAGYDASISKYLKAPHSNATNKVIQCLKDPVLRKEMLTYCGYDALFTFNLAMLQQEQMTKSDRKGYSLLHNGILALSNAEQFGMRVDVPYLEAKEKELETLITRLKEDLDSSKLVKQWRQAYAGTFNISSDTQLAKVLYDIRKIKPKKFTKTGKGSTDAEALKLLNIPEITKLVELRKVEKALGTYVKAYLREQVDGIIHPLFNLHTVMTYRSSSESPNFQNVPKRDPFIMKLVRDAFIPRKGHRLVEYDFGQLEVSIAAAYHNDPVMLSYLNEGGDMHGDLAAQIFKIKDFDKDNKEHSHLRKATKNGFIFPQFYGDYYVNNAESIRQWVGLPEGSWKKAKGEPQWIGQHMVKNKIGSLKAFIQYLKGIEYDFWNKRFKVYQRWKDKLVNKYKREGVTTAKTGFTFRAPMAKNQLINAPVQGAAFHCLLWLFIEADKIFVKRKMKTRLIGQIHDAVVVDVHDKEFKAVNKIIKELAIKELPKAFPWINAQLKIDGECAGVDRPWSEVKEFEF